MKLTPYQLEGAAAVLAELRRVYDARIDYMQLVLGVREIADHYGLPWPLAALKLGGATDSLADLSAAMQEVAAVLPEQFPAEVVRDPAGAAGTAPAARRDFIASLRAAPVVEGVG